MRTALDTPLDALDEGERNCVSNVLEHGWFHTAVFGDDEGPGFSYTTGFWLNTQFPEVMLFSMKRETAHTVLWDLFRDLKAGNVPAIGKVSADIFGNANAVLVPVAKAHYGEYLGWNRWFYQGDEFPCVQLVWPDRAGAFPWQSTFGKEFEGLQPDLTEQGWVAALSH
jgi:hypothetical protein